MDKITRLSIAKIRKHKKESILLGVLVFICTVLLGSSVSALAGISKITPSMVRSTGCYENSVTVDQRSYTNDFLSFAENDDRVEKYDHIRAASASVIKINGKEDSMSFVSVEGEKAYERFDAEEGDIEHPIWLDSSRKDSLSVDKGDELTFTYNKKDYTFTVAGFYDQGIWPLGAKAVVNEDDLLYLEGYMERKEVIGINLKDGVDSQAFLKEFEDNCMNIAAGDITADIFISSYEDTVVNNNFNMMILSIIVAVMAGIAVIAIIVMIRYRIVGDIREQIVSIGVLEALGYRSREIAKSYVREYFMISAAGALLGIVPGLLLSRFLVSEAASTIFFGGSIGIEVVPFLISVISLLLFIVMVARSKAMKVRKFPPVVAFRKGLETHNFKRSSFPLEKTKGSVHVRLALKGFRDNMRSSFGLGFCISCAAVTVVLSFILCSFFADSDNILHSVCGHELCDIRIETVGMIDDEDFRSELQAMPEVEKVNPVAVGEAVKFTDSDVEMTVEVYDDYDMTSTIVLTEGRLPEHDNEIAMTTQGQPRTNAHIGDTVTVEYGKVRRDYVVTGFINSVVDASTCYLTTSGFRAINPSYTPDAFDIYLKEGEDKEAFSTLLTQRYGKNIIDVYNSEVTGDTYEERIRSAAEIKMAEAMVNEGVSYMEYAIDVDGQMITGSTNTIKINSMTYVADDYAAMASSLTNIFTIVTMVLMAVSAVVVMIILSILMESTIRKQYRDLGIMKSMGYTSKQLMFQTAFRIVPTAIIAVVTGTLISIVLVKLLEIVVAKISISVIGVTVVNIAILLFCFICAYMSTRKIRKISVYELMTE